MMTKPIVTPLVQLMFACSLLWISGCSERPEIKLPALDKVASRAVNKVPDFAAITDIKARKEAFFQFLTPMARAENDRLQQVRDTMLQLQQKQARGEPLSQPQQAWLKTLAEKYDVEDGSGDAAFWRALDRRIDQVPVSLLLAQGALESAWGTSRFALQANNLFGQWCFSKGCGLVPNARAADMSHEVRKFKTVNESVRAYMLNLNRHPVYQHLRDIRQRLRTKGEPVMGVALASGLERYSERGKAYVNEVKSMISYNKLFVYDRETES